MTQTTHHTDHQLKTAVADELTWTSTVDADHIGVSVNDGAVTLSGEVTNYPEKSAAVAAALRVAGVTSVADEIAVRSPSNRDDVGIASLAKQALDTSTTVPRTVHATVHDHCVTLTGAVPWHYQRRAAVRLIEQIPGVRFVRNDIRITPQLPFAAEIAERNIRTALIRNAEVDADRIHVTTVGTEIELNGTAHSWAERNAAGNVAWNTPGVTHVRNNLRIVL